MSAKPIFIILLSSFVVFFVLLLGYQNYTLQSQVVHLETHLASHLDQQSELQLKNAATEKLRENAIQSCPACELTCPECKVSCPECPACPSCPAPVEPAVCASNETPKHEWDDKVLNSIFSAFFDVIGPEETEVHQPKYTQPGDEMGEKIVSFESTEDCSVVHGLSPNARRSVQVVSWLPPILTEYEIDSMSGIDLAVALGLVENHEWNRNAAERRMDIISKFTHTEWAKMASAYLKKHGQNGDMPSLNQCFADQMMVREKVKETRYILLADHVHTAMMNGQSHNEILKHCSRCSEDPICLAENIGRSADTAEHGRLQQLADVMLRPTINTFHWIGRAQLAIFLKRQIQKRKREIETAIRWNLCHPAVASVTLAVRDARDVPPYLAGLNLHIDVLKSVTYATMTHLLGRKGVGMITRADVFLGENIGATDWISDGEALALSPHEAAPSFKTGISPLSFCDEKIGGEHTAIALSLPVKTHPDMAVVPGLQGADGQFLRALCPDYRIRNPCKAVRVYRFTQVKPIRETPHFGIYGRTAMQPAVSCAPGVEDCCQLGTGPRVSGKNETSWQALMNSGLYKLHSGVDEPFDPSALGYAEADMAPLTAAVQKFLWNWQHPADCSTAKFMMARDFGPSGIGSQLHMLTYSFSKALDAGRILYHNIGGQYADGWCPEDSRYYQCYFLPVTNCTRESMKDLIEAPGYEKSWNYLLHFPKVFEKWLREREIIVPNYYWWRGQALTYVMRMNAQTKKEMVDRRKKIWDLGVVVEPNTVSAHVRHGDKAHEMRLVPFSEFVGAAAMHFPTRKMFISSEDPSVITEAEKMQSVWEMKWIDIPRLNGGPFTNVAKFGASEEFLSSFLNLLVALECDHFIGTRGSNWNRMIDELRRTWSGRERSPFVEVGDRHYGT